MKVELELSDKPEVHYIASALNLDTDSVVGKLIRAWSWFDKHTEDGHAYGVTFVTLDKVVGHAGFGEAMMLAGWLEQKDKTIVMPKFDRHTSESAKKRALASKRKSRQRHAVSVTETGPEKRREEVKEAEPDGSLDPIWGPGLQILLTTGVPENHARSFLGALLGSWDSADVLEALQSASGKGDPRSYVRGVLRTKPKKGERGKLRVAL